MDFNTVFEKLGLSRDNGLFIISEDRWKGFLPKRTEEILENKLNPYAFFSFNNSPFILFFENPSNLSTLFHQCWNFNETPLIFVIEDNQITIYNGFSYIKENKSLQVLASEEELTQFEYFKIVTGKTWDEYKQIFAKEDRVDQKLLANIAVVRNKLLNVHHLKTEVANNLIGRIIFVRYLIDRKVKIAFSNKNGESLSNKDFCNILASRSETYRLFEYLQTEFNGNLFPLSDQENKRVTKNALYELVKLLQGEDIGNGQLSLFDVYDFSIIPIELVSNVYEFFIGKDQQAKGGAYYTPLFLVNYILNETIENHFKINSNSYSCKVLDPACGSGVFLVETLRKIIFQFQKLNPDFKKDIQNYKDNLKLLLTENIFGIDKDPNAVNVAIFSLYITLLDYLQPPEIVNFKFPSLLENNFFVSDFFDLEATFNEKWNTKKLRFDFIVGNPPWGKIRESEDLYQKYWKNREKKESKSLQSLMHNNAKVEIKVGNKEISQVFLIRVSDFCDKNTDCALIVTSKNLYNINAKTYRKYFLSNFKIEKVFELSSVRREVFDKSNDPSIAPATILFYKYSPDKKLNLYNLVQHISLKPNRFFSLFKLFVIEKYDQKKIQQRYFIEYDWIWKVLMYGNIFDFYLIKRLNKHSKLIDIMNDGTKFIYGKGICVKGKDKYPVGDLSKIPYFVDTKKQNLKAFHITYSKNEIKNSDFLHRPRKIDLYKAPMILVKKGINSKFKAISAFSNYDCVFTDSITSIKAFHDEDASFLKLLSGLFNSTFFSYFLLLTSSSLGIEREQAHDKEDKFQLPIPFENSEIDNSILDTIIQIEKTSKAEVITKNNETEISQKYFEIIKKLSSLCSKLDQQIELLYKMTNIEKELIDYSQKISIPLVKKQFDHPSFKELKFQSKELIDYAMIFINHFNKIYNVENNYFEAEIWYSRYIIGMNFKVINEKPKNNEEILWINNKDSNLILKNFSLLGYSSLAENLFIQKDIKGFEADSFYIIKPNEYKCWHRAIAYLDLGEIIETLTVSGAKQTFESMND